MIWSLNHHDTIKYTSESTIRAFDPTSADPRLSDFQVSKFTLFTEAQRDAVIGFLQAFLPDPRSRPDRVRGADKPLAAPLSRRNDLTREVAGRRPYAVGTYRPSDVLESLLADIVKSGVYLTHHLVVHCRR